ncbi:MAG: hypothetical protein ACRDVK_10170 [Acidimicrobiia bacterium]
MKGLVWLLLVACSSGVTATSVTSPTGADIPPDPVADQVAAALEGGDPMIVAGLTDLGPMGWLALAEGATVEEAAGIDEGESAMSVASNFWSGFLQSAGLAGDTVSNIEAFTEGATDFARLKLPSGSIILNQSDANWRIDVIASFGAPLAERLLSAVEVIAANRSSEADVLREMLRAERDAVAVAIADPSITTSARAAVEDVLTAIDSIDD